MMEGETMTEDQAERLIRELSLQLDRINDHLNGIDNFRELEICLYYWGIQLQWERRDRPAQ